MVWGWDPPTFNLFELWPANTRLTFLASAGSIKEQATNSNRSPTGQELFWARALRLIVAISGDPKREQEPPKSEHPRAVLCRQTWRLVGFPDQPRYPSNPVLTCVHCGWETVAGSPGSQGREWGDPPGSLHRLTWVNHLFLFHRANATPIRVCKGDRSSGLLRTIADSPVLLRRTAGVWPGILIIPRSQPHALRGRAAGLPRALGFSGFPSP